MKTLPFIALLLCSCEVAPYVKESANGNTYSMGGVFAARRKNTVAEITSPSGVHIKFMSEEESGEDVPNNAIAAWLSKGLAAISGHSADLKTKTDSATTLGLGAQSVEKAQIKSAEKVTLGTFVPPKE